MSQEFEAADPSGNPDAPKEADSKRPSPRLKIPVPPDLPLDDPEQGSPHRRLSTVVGINFLLLLACLVGLGLVFLRLTKDEKAATVGSSEKTTSAAKPEEVQAVAAEVDKVKAGLADLSRKVDGLATPSPSPDNKAIQEKVDDLSKTVADFPARLDSLGQKLEVVSKAEGQAPSAKVDAMEKKVGELASAVDALKNSPPTQHRAETTPTTSPRPVDVNAEGQAMEQAVDLFKAGKYADAKAAFAKLQSAYPDDARVWYFSALSNGLATRDWKGESERLVNVGVAKEKAGSPDRAKIDAALSGLTTVTGKDWLAFYRKQATQ